MSNQAIVRGFKLNNCRICGGVPSVRDYSGALACVSVSCKSDECREISVRAVVRPTLALAGREWNRVN